MRIYAPRQLRMTQMGEIARPLIRRMRIANEVLAPLWTLGFVASLIYDRQLTPLCKGGMPFGCIAKHAMQKGTATSEKDVALPNWSRPTLTLPWAFGRLCPGRSEQRRRRHRWRHQKSALREAQRLASPASVFGQTGGQTDFQEPSISVSHDRTFSMDRSEQV